MSDIVELLVQTAAADTDLLLNSDRLGDNLSIPREVDFLLRAPSADKAKLVTGFVNDFHYGEATAKSDEHGHRVSIRITMPITQNVVHSISGSGFMACLSKLYELDYDGWGSVIQRGA